MTPNAAGKILICDDDIDILEATQAVLSIAGYATETASEHAELLAKVEAWSPDLILLDIRLPDHDGIWIAEELQRRMRNPPPIIFFSGHNRSFYRFSAPIEGAVDFLAKPFDPDVLLHKVERALKGGSGSNGVLLATFAGPAYTEQTTE